MKELINKIFEKFPGVKLHHLSEGYLEIKMGGTGRIIAITPQRVNELIDGGYVVTTTSQWVQGILQGKVRDDKGNLS